MFGRRRVQMAQIRLCTQDAAKLMSIFDVSCLGCAASRPRPSCCCAGIMSSDLDVPDGLATLSETTWWQRKRTRGCCTLRVRVTLLVAEGIQTVMRPERAPEFGSLTDSQLLRRSSHEPEAFGVFYDRHIKDVLAFFARRTSSADLSAELTAETFAQAFLSRGRYHDMGGPATAWLFVIARRQLTRLLRRGAVEEKARRRLGLERIALSDETIERIESLADMEPLRQELRAAMAHLSPKVAAAVFLRVGEALPFKEVANRLGCTEAAARVRVSRGLAELTNLMGVN